MSERFSINDLRSCLKCLTSLVEKDVIESFKINELVYNTWNGNESDTSLYNFWKQLKICSSSIDLNDQVIPALYKISVFALIKFFILLLLQNVKTTMNSICKENMAH